MAAYHFSAKIHSRAKGASGVRAAAYRAGERLRDERLGKTEDYSRKSDVIETAILAPEGAPGWVFQREELWNRVERRERRYDAQVAQEYEINLPRGFSDAENWKLVTDFARGYLVKHGRICDIAFHLSEAKDGAPHPHAHILMPLRSLEDGEFGAKHPDCSWKHFFSRTDRLGELRREWAEFSRGRAAELGIDLGADWDHRSYEERGVDIEPEPKIGGAAHRIAREEGGSERVTEALETARRNGERLLRNPGLALQALTCQQSTFTEQDLARWVHRHSADDQFEAIFAAAKSAAVLIGVDQRGHSRYSTAEMVELERGMLASAAELGSKRRHNIDAGATERALKASELSEAQQTAARQILTGSDLSALVGYAGSGKSTMLREVRDIYEKRGFKVHGAALSGIAAENLERGSGIAARTLASRSYYWARGSDLLSAKDVLVVDEAGMIGSRQMAVLIENARKAGAKLILVGDPEQLQAIEAGAAFRAISERVETAELVEVWRQRDEWQRTATKEFACGSTRAALARYEQAGSIVRTDTDDAARIALVAEWMAARTAKPAGSAIMLAHTRADTAALNAKARDALRDAGALGPDVELETSRGRVAFATGDRILFLRNDRGLAVKNGTIGTVERISKDVLKVRDDAGRQFRVNLLEYVDIAHGYAVTIHKAQGITVDKSFVLATAGFDRHLAYVAMTRHRESAKLVYSAEQFAKPTDLSRALSRERAKDVTADYSNDMAEVRDLSIKSTAGFKKNAPWSRTLLPGADHTAGRKGPTRGPER